MRRKLKTKGNFTVSLLLKLAVFSFVVYIVWMLVQLQVDLINSKAELESSLQKRDEYVLKNQEIEQLISMGDDDEFIERIAREKFDFAYPDEKVFIDISGS